MYYALAKYLPDIGITGVQDPSLIFSANTKPFKTVKAAAAAYVVELLRVQDSGPYCLAGWSMGGKVALEMAQILRSIGKEVSTVILIDSNLTEKYHQLQFWKDNILKAVPFLREKVHMKKQTYEDEGRRHHAITLGLFEKVLGKKEDGQPEVPLFTYPNVKSMLRTLNKHMKAAARYIPSHYNGHVFIIQSDDSRLPKEGSISHFADEWRSICDEVTVRDAPGDHFSIMREPNIQVVAGHILEALSWGTVGKPLLIKDP